MFDPTQEIEWLGIVWDAKHFSIKIPDRRINDTLRYLAEIISVFPKISARDLARVVGKIISMSPVLGNVCNIMTRFCSMKIANRDSWDEILKITDSENDTIYRELLFWSKNINSKNMRFLSEYM